MIYEIRATGYPMMRFTDYTKRESVRLYRKKYNLKGKRIELYVERIMRLRYLGC